MNPIRTLIADDEKPARTRVLELIGQRNDFEVIGVARDGRETLALIQAREPDMLLLDIQMPLLDGFEVLRHLGPGRAPFTIFVTAHDEYALRAFEAHALDYLLKPFSDERFDTALTRAREMIEHRSTNQWTSRIGALLREDGPLEQQACPLDRIVLRTGGKLTFLEVKNLDWIQATGVYLHLHAHGKTHLYRSAMNAFLERLDQTQFVRIHKSIVVNTERIRELRPRGHGDFIVVLHDGQELQLSRAYRSSLERWLRQRL